MAINDPRDISGLVLWLSADAVTGLSDNTQMTSWSDLSGVGNNATAIGVTKPKWRSSAGTTGGPAVEFLNDGYFTLPNLLSGATAGEMMMSVRHNTGNTGSWAFGAGTGNDDEAHYPYAGAVYESFGLATGQRKNFTPSMAISSWRRYDVWVAANDFSASLDETSQVTSSTATVAWTSTPAIGAGRKDSNIDMRFSGWISCFLVYSRKLTTTERADLATWLAANPSGGTASSVITGSLAATESGSDTAAFAGDVYVAGSLAATEIGTDTTSLSGAVLVQGALSATETGSDTAEFTGSASGIITGALAATESGADAAALSGVVLVAGTLAATESGADTAAFSGIATGAIAGSLAAIESGADVAALSGAVLAQGALSATESGGDAASLIGGVRVSGSLAVAETGSDTAVATGAVQVRGAFSLAESGADTATLTGAILVRGGLSSIESGADTSAIAGAVLVQGALSASEVGSDTAEFMGDASPEGVGTLNAREEGSDSASFLGAIPVRGSAAITETGADVAIVVGNVLVQGAFALSESGQDTAAIHGVLAYRVRAELTATIGARPVLCADLKAVETLVMSIETAPRLNASATATPAIRHDTKTRAAVDSTLRTRG